MTGPSSFFDLLFNESCKVGVLIFGLHDIRLFLASSRRASVQRTQV